MPLPVATTPLLLPDPEPLELLELLPELELRPPELLPDPEPEPPLLSERVPLLLPDPELPDDPLLAETAPELLADPLTIGEAPLEELAPAELELAPLAPPLAAGGMPHCVEEEGELEQSHAPPASAATTQGGTIHPIFFMITSSDRTHDGHAVTRFLGNRDRKLMSD
jgi:hypothetical protein